MNNCENCANHNSELCHDCVITYVNRVRKGPSNWKPFPITNGDRIRAMSDEELARLFANEIPHGDCTGATWSVLPLWAIDLWIAVSRLGTGGFKRLWRTDNDGLSYNTK